MFVWHLLSIILIVLQRSQHLQASNILRHKRPDDKQHVSTKKHEQDSVFRQAIAKSTISIAKELNKIDMQEKLKNNSVMITHMIGKTLDEHEYTYQILVSKMLSKHEQSENLSTKKALRYMLKQVVETLQQSQNPKYLQSGQSITTEEIVSMTESNFLRVTVLSKLSAKCDITHTRLVLDAYPTVFDEFEQEGICIKLNLCPSLKHVCKSCR